MTVLRMVNYKIRTPMDCPMRINYTCCHPDRKKEPLEKCKCTGKRFPLKCPWEVLYD